MITVPTSAEIRQAREDTVRAWSSRLSVVQGPALAGLGASVTVLRAVADPLSPTLHRAGLASVTRFLEVAAPPPAHRGFATAEPASSPRPAARRGPGADERSSRPSVPTRAGVYGELAWRGWQAVHRVRTAPTVANLLRRARALAEHANSAVEGWCDELHDGSEEILGTLIMGTHRIRDRATAALLTFAYALRTATADPGDQL